MHVAMISTGEEVLHGDITDTNAAWLSRIFFQQGFPLSRRTTVGDHLETLAAEIEHCSLIADVVVVNGGLGPTTDDLTAQAAAVAAGSGLEQSDYWVEQMQEKYRALGREMPHTNLKQAMLPEGAELLKNPIGTACGFAMKLNRAWLYFTPGVPREFKMMVQDEILPRIRERFEHSHAKDCHRFYTFGLSESGIGQQLQDLNVPDEYEVGYRSSLPFIEVKLFSPKGDGMAPQLQHQMIELLGDNVVSVERELPIHVGHVLKERQLHLALQEQFSGGWLTNWLQDYPDSRKALLQGKVVQEKALVSDVQVADPLLAVTVQAPSIMKESGAQLALVSGAEYEEGIPVALITPEGEWAQIIKSKRHYEYRAYRNVIATVMLDMLRRYLDGKPVIGQYEFLTRVR
ncbi:CinA family nicotinamide mononucleotide deamidase-related protein [Photobacterium marinum]|nr:CinA family nicotinamide mononucleotide deamidase-related protein [Photobacterium marinum]